MPEPLVSIVIPTFRREMMLVDAIRSVLSQSGVRVEVIVLDDSPEGSAAAAVAGCADARVRYVHRAVPSGGRPAVVRNDGLSLAGGKYVHFLDDDDVLAEGALAATVGALEAAPHAGVAIGLVVPFGDDPVALAREQAYFGAATQRLRAIRARLALVAEMLFQKTPLVNSSCTIRRTCAVAVGGYTPTIPMNEDVDFYLRAVRRGGFVLVDVPVVHYRVGQPSLMHSLTDFSVLAEAYGMIHQQYRREHGAIEFTLLRAYGLALRLAGRVRARRHAAAGLVHAAPRVAG